VFYFALALVAAGVPCMAILTQRTLPGFFTAIIVGAVALAIPTFMYWPHPFGCLQGSCDGMFIVDILWWLTLLGWGLAMTAAIIRGLIFWRDSPKR